MEKFVNYLKAQMDKTTAWIGAIGLVLFFLGLHSLLFVLFILLIILPESNFSDWAKKGAQSVRDLDKRP